MDATDKAIERLREQRRRRKQALALRDQGKTLQEIGDLMGVSRQRAEQMVQRARKDAQAD